MVVSKSDEKIDSIIQLLKNQKAFQEAMNVRMTNLKAQVALRVGFGDIAVSDSTFQPFSRTSLKLDMP